MERRILATGRTVVLRVAVFVGLLESKVLFYALRGVADDTRVPTQGTALSALDRAIGLGATPGQRLQALLFTGHVNAFDWFWVVAYESWLFVPTLVTIYVLVFHWDQIGAYLPMRLAAYFIPLFLFFLMPSEPPWMATSTVRITDLANGFVRLDSNQLAAFPSLHVTLTVALAYWLWSKRLNVAAALFSLYTAIIVFAVLYLGEHYFIDVVAGAALAVAIVRVSARAERAVATRSFALPRLGWNLSRPARIEVGTDASMSDEAA
jgi:membrane-associated phospholipid phosphatase